MNGLEGAAGTSIPRRLEGRVAIVTGAGEGIGRAVAVRFAQEGARVVVASRRREPLEETRAEIEAVGGEALVVPTDVSDWDAVQAMSAATIDAYGQVDILVTIAGFTKPAMLHRMSVDDWHAVMGVHLHGTFYCIRSVVENMIEREHGRIITVSSAAGLVGTLGQVNYSAAKGGVVALTKSCARELGKYRITANCVAPGAETKMTDTIVNDPKFKDKYLARIPLGYWAKPEEVAPTFAWLASDDAAYTTGYVIGADGGLSIH
ncbi:MAG TPA: glucose 1-dehydrogenase [Thermoleophilia bacterium]|nr:glucose 1-dehydrogenase [Thermoleophilia bacterium]